MSDPSNRRSTRRNPNEYENWTRVGNYYFIKPPREWTDSEGIRRCDYGALEMRHKNDTEGFSMYAKGIWPPKDAFFPYGGGRDLLTLDEYDDIQRHNIPKYGGDSRSHYMVNYRTGPGDEDVMYVDAHPRHARKLNYPENCCWPASRLQTCNRGQNQKVNLILDRIDESKYGEKKLPTGCSLPVYPYIHWPVFAYSTEQIKDGDELLLWYGWSKNALTRFIGPEIKTNTGHRKSKSADPNAISESKELRLKTIQAAEEEENSSSSSSGSSSSSNSSSSGSASNTFAAISSSSSSNSSSSGSASNTFAAITTIDPTVVHSSSSSSNSSSSGSNSSSSGSGSNTSATIKTADPAAVQQPSSTAKTNQKRSRSKTTTNKKTADPAAVQQQSSTSKKNNKRSKRKYLTKGERRVKRARYAKKEATSLPSNDSSIATVDAAAGLLQLHGQPGITNLDTPPPPLLNPPPPAAAPATHQQLGGSIAGSIKLFIESGHCTDNKNVKSLLRTIANKAKHLSEM